MKLFWVLYAKMRSYMEKITTMDFNGVFSSIMEEKKTHMYLMEHIYELWNQLWIFTKKIQSLVSLIVSIVFNDLSRVGSYIYWTF